LQLTKSLEGFSISTPRSEELVCDGRLISSVDDLLLNYLKIVTGKQTGKRDPPEVIGLSGPSGCGKTRYVFSLCERKGLGLWSWSGGVWFDGYRGQDCALFDDLDAKAVSDFGRGFMLRVLDRYPMSVPVKGDFVKWVPKVIFITSNFSAGELVNYQDEFMRPLLRRISIWVEFDETTSEWKECEGVGGFSGGRQRIYEDVSTFLAELE
jgi:hypothetical protein